MSTTPSFPPPDDVTASYRLSFNPAASPFLIPELAGLIPLPESPLPLYEDSAAHHSHIHRDHYPQHRRTSSGVSFLEPGNVKLERTE